MFSCSSTPRHNHLLDTTDTARFAVQNAQVSFLGPSHHNPVSHVTNTVFNTSTKYAHWRLQICLNCRLQGYS